MQYTYTLIFPLFSGVLFGIVHFFLKKFNDKHTLVCLGNLIGGIFLLLLSFVFEECHLELLKIHYPTLFLSGIIHTLNVNFLISSYSKDNLSVALPISKGVAISTSAVTSYFLFYKEINITTMIGILLAIIGIFSLKWNCLANKEKSFKGTYYAILTGISVSLYLIVDKLILEAIPPLLLSAFVCLFIGTSILCVTIFKKNIKEISILVKRNYKKSLIVTLNTFSYFLFLNGLANLTPISALLSSQTSVILGIALGFIVLREDITRSKLIGTFLIMLGIIYTNI